MKKEFKLDLERLHNVALENVNGSRCGKTTLFIYDMIGIAQTNAFSFSKEKRVIYIPFSRDIRSILSVIDRIEEICTSEKTPFAKIDNGTITILDTVFSFVRNYDEDFVRIGCEKYVWWNNDYCIDCQTGFELYEHLSKVSQSASIINLDNFTRTFW